MTDTQTEIAHLKQNIYEMRRTFLEQIDGVMSRIERLSGTDEPTPQKEPRTKAEYKKYFEGG